jgi:anti-sigma B factor antagonist
MHATATAGRQQSPEVIRLKSTQGLDVEPPELFNPAQPRRAGPARLAIMQINERSLAGLTILDLNGKLTIDNGAQLLKDKCESLAFQQRTQVIANLAGVPYIDSGGLGQLVACYTTLGKAGGRLTLANINKTNHDLLSITKLVAVFETFDSEETAVQSYAAGVRG